MLGILGLAILAAVLIIPPVVGFTGGCTAIGATAGALKVLIPNSTARAFIGLVWAMVYLYLGISAFTIKGAGMNFIYALLIFWIPAIVLLMIANNSKSN